MVMSVVIVMVGCRAIKEAMKNKAQSTLEYLVVLAVIIAVVVTAARTVIKPSVEGSLNRLGNAIKKATNTF